MEINIGTKIRELRKKKELTQEELAVKLSVSNQAVSKWESSTCYPDMAQIPILANFFGVSLDELFGYDASLVNKKIDEIIAEHNKYFWKERKKAEEILVNGLKEYPENDRLLTELIELYSSEAPEKALAMAEQYATFISDLLLLGRVKRVLTGLYVKLERFEDANKVVESLPAMYPMDICDRLRVGAGELRGADRLKWATQLKTEEIQELYITCDMEGNGYWEIADYENALRSYGEYRRIIELFMRSDEIDLDSYSSYPYLEMQTHHWASTLQEAACLAKLGRADEAKEKIERAKYILLHGWATKDGSINYLAKNPEQYLNPFREIYSRWELDELVPCPL